MKFQKKCLTKMHAGRPGLDGKDRAVCQPQHGHDPTCNGRRCIVLDKGKVVFDGGVDEGIALYLSTKSQETAFY